MDGMDGMERKKREEDLKDALLSLIKCEQDETEEKWCVVCRCEERGECGDVRRREL